jgi:hypothetical protein
MLFCIGQDNKTGDFMKRKVFLALALFALMAVGVYAQTEADFRVTKSADGKSVEITMYRGKETTVNIPAKIQNLPVTSIGKSAFAVNMSITGVTIPNGVTIIEAEAFTTCAQLTNVTIPSSVKIIKNGAFANCSNLTNITIPASVTEIGDRAFSYCRGITSVTFGGTIPSGSFVANAFEGLGDIRDKFYATDKAKGTAGTYTRPNDPSTTWTRGGSATVAPAAAGTPGLAFTLTSDGKSYSVNKGTLTANSVANVVIPDTYNNLPVTKIASMGFNAVLSMTSVTIPASVTSIDSMAFMSLPALKSVTFGGANAKFYAQTFEGDLLQKYQAGGAGTYTTSDGKTWTKK